MSGENKDSFSLALAQANPVVGDIAGNLYTATVLRSGFRAAGADLIVFSELFLTGYPLEDLVLKPALQRAAREACETWAKVTADGGPAMLMGLPWVEEGDVYNAVALLAEGRAADVRYKHHLPNYGVFDEKRVLPGPLPCPGLAVIQLGVLLVKTFGRAMSGAPHCPVPGPTSWIARNASSAGWGTGLATVASGEALPRRTSPARPNQLLKGQDELVPDGASFVLNADGVRAVQLPPGVMPRPWT